MARKLVTLEEAAQQLGVSPEELLEMRSRNDISGYRDGSTWKFKPEDVERLVEERAGGSTGESSELDILPVEGLESDEDMVLLSEVELGAPTAGMSSTIIGKHGASESPEDSDIKLAAVRPAEAPSKSEITLSPAGKKKASDSSGSDLPIDTKQTVLEAASPKSSPSGIGSDITLAGPDAGSDIVLSEPDPGSDLTFGEPDPGSDLTFGDAKVPLAGGDDVLLSDDGAGSDITLSPGDSGISLVDATDSGISLDEAPELARVTRSSSDAGSSDDSSSYDLGSDDASSSHDSYESSYDSSSSSGDSRNIKTMSAEFDSDAVMELKTDDEFLLTPLEEVTDEESQDSGSQVIALDTDDSGIDSSGSALLGPDLSAGGFGGGILEVADDGGLLSGGIGGQVMLGTGSALSMAPVTREGQFSTGVLISLFCCVFVMLMTGLMMFDLMRNMWSWDGPHSVNSSIMNTIIGLFP